MQYVNLDLLHYHEWATSKLLNHVNQLPKEIFDTKLKGTFTSILETFTHIYEIDTTWFKRINSEFKPTQITIESPEIALIHFKNLHSAMIEFLKNHSLTEIVYQNSKGETFHNDINEIIQHLSNHGTYHRGNIATMIRQLGCEGISTDYIFYIRNKREENPEFKNR